MPSRFRREAGQSLGSQEENLRGPAAVKKMSTDFVDRNARSMEFVRRWNGGGKRALIG